MHTKRCDNIQLKWNAHQQSDFHFFLSKLVSNHDSVFFISKIESKWLFVTGLQNETYLLLYFYDESASFSHVW